MAKQYWVGEFYVDLSRNQISQLGQSQTLPPKALLVLTLLAKNRGKVVTYDELLDEVWPNAVVTPNTLQRSIAQLRKALGEDSKVQGIIKTHAKQGYSLESEVNWQEGVKPSPVNPSASQTPTLQEHSLQNPTLTATENKRGKVNYVIAATIAVFIFIGVVLFKPSQPHAEFSVISIQAMTATDNKEFDATYSTGDEYIIFNRYHEQVCKSRIWAKHIATQQETLLTPEWGNYGNASLSPDGSQLAFIQEQNCQMPLPQKPCYSLNQLDFQKALAGNATPQTLMTCSNAQIKMQQWLSNDALVLIHKAEAQWQLLKLNVADGNTEVLYQPLDGYILSFDVSLAQSKIALTKYSDASQPYLDVLTLDGELLSSNAIELHEDMPFFSKVLPRFIANQAMLMFSTGRQLFSLSLAGKVNKISLPLDEPMGTPRFNQSGSKALATKGNFDSDIGTLALVPPAASSPSISDLTLVEAVPVNIARSNAREEKAIFSPNGNAVAFVSTRSGTRQLWLKTQDTLTQLTHLPLDTPIFGFRWAKDGNSLLVSSGGELHRVFLDQSTQQVHVVESVINLFHWDSESQTALANMLVKGKGVLAEIDLNNGTYVKRRQGWVFWAAKSEEGRLVYLDFNYQFWQSQVTENATIAQLKTQGSDHQFVLDGETIYGVDKDQNLWAYKLSSEEFTKLGDAPKNIDTLTDIQNNELLISYVVAAKKEIVELKLGQTAP